jgi:UDP-N-acetylmuramoylalanine--D-glutamate ligase
VLLNIYREHLDYYRDFREYLRTKQNICLWQKKEDFFIYNPENKYVRETAKLTKAKKIPIDVNEIKKIIKLKEIPLIGKFNLQNIAAAIKVGEIFGVSKKDIKKAIKNFKGLPHRLEFVGKFSGIKFYNDSLSTIPETTIFAIEALGKDLQTIILGGFERKQNFSKLAKKILKSNIKTVILFPTTGKRIWQEILSQKQLSKKRKKRKLPKHFFVDNMKDAVKLAFENTQSEKICLLSPAAASFNLFENYIQRGNLFKKYVKFFGKK